MEELQKKLKAALASEISPLLIGLRNEIKALNELAARIAAKEPPDVQAVEVQNDPRAELTERLEAVRKATQEAGEATQKAVADFTQKLLVEISAGEDLSRAVMRGVREDVRAEGEQGRGAFAKAIEAMGAGIVKTMLQLKTAIWRVEITNPPELKLPDVIKAEITNQPEEPAERRVRIVNEKPEEAVPVVLTSKDRKRFYEVMIALSGIGGGESLANIAGLLQQIIQNTADIELKADTININLDQLEGFVDQLEAFTDGIEGLLTTIRDNADTVEVKLQAVIDNTDSLEAKLDTIISLLGGAAGGTFHVFGDITLATATETTIATFTVPAGKKAVLREITFEGEGAALFTAYLGSAAQYAGRITITDPSDNASVMVEGSAAQVFTLKVTPDGAGTATRHFRGSLSGTIT